MTTIFQCSPVQGFWDHTISASCSVNVYAFFIGNAVPNILTDWALLVLPIPYIWRLQQNRTTKIALCGVFLLGGLYDTLLFIVFDIYLCSHNVVLIYLSSICIISIVRLCIMSTQLFNTTSTDITWLFNDSSTWTAVEVNMGVVSGQSRTATYYLGSSHLTLIACLPSLRPLLTAYAARAKKSHSSSDSEEVLSGGKSPPPPRARYEQNRHYKAGVTVDTLIEVDTRPKVELSTQFTH